MKSRSLIIDPKYKGPRPTTRRRIEVALIYLLLFIVSIFTIGPFLWTVSTSLKDASANLFTYPPQFLPSPPTLENYPKSFQFITVQNIWNSFVIAAGGTVLDVFLCSLAAYPLARYAFPGKRLLMGLLLMTLMLPLYTTLVVNFITLKSFGLVDTLLGVILPTAVTVPGLFILRQGYLGLPIDLEDAARVDGASELRIWAQIMLPLIKPSIAALVVFDFVNNWNSFLWPLIVLNDPSKYPVTLALQQAMNSAFSSNMREVAAGTVVSMVPILIIFLFAQRYFISGSLSGSVKG